jgi:hypothetical protein
VLPSDIVAIAAAVWDTMIASHLTAGSTGEALDNAGGGGGGGITAADVWTYGTRTLTASLDPTANQVATAVRSELSTELARIDVATSTRLATSGYTAAPSASDNATAVLSAAQAAPIHADIRKVNDYVVDGQGTASDPWGPV